MGVNKGGIGTLSSENRQDIKRQLEAELSEIEFTETMKRHVMNKRKPTFWEREVTIPLVPVSFVLLLCVVIGALGINLDDFKDKTQLTDKSPEYVDIGGTVMHKHWLVRGEE